MIVKNISNTIITKIDLQICNYSLFSNGDDVINDTILRTKIIEKISYYYCPVSNFTFNITPDTFENGHIYLDFSLRLKNYTFYDTAYKDLLTRAPYVNLIYKQIGLNIESKSQPYKSFIENTMNTIDPEYVKRTEMRIEPLEIMDDDDAFSLGSFKYYKNNLVSSQNNGTAFRYSRYSDFFEAEGNRTNISSLAFNRFYMRLGTSCNVSLRLFQKFSDFLASVGAIISNLLLLIVILMSQINKINGRHLLLESMFSYNIIRDIKKFKKEAKIHFNKNSNAETKIKVNKKEGNKKDDINLEFSEDYAQRFKTLNENINYIKLSDINIEPNFKTEFFNGNKIESNLVCEIVDKSKGNSKIKNSTHFR